MKTPTPKHRAIIHLAADMRKGAGAHSVARKPGPTADEWDEKEVARSCGNKDCSISSGIHNDDSSIHSGLTFGSGELDDMGYWENPCHICARTHEAEQPLSIPCWPFTEV